MRKFFEAILLTICILFSVDVFAGPGYPEQCCNTNYNPTSCRYMTCEEKLIGASSASPFHVILKDQNSNDEADVQLMNSAMAVTELGLNVRSFGFGYEPGSNLILRLELDDGLGNALTNDINALATGSRTLGYLSATNTWARIQALTYDANFAVTARGLQVLSGNYFYDLTNTKWYRLDGDVLSNDEIVGTNRAPFEIGFMHGWNGTKWQRVDVDAQGDLTTNQTTTNPGYGRWQDGDSTVVADVLDTYADGLALSLNGGMTGAVLYGSNGATLDKVRLDALGGLVTGRNWSIAGESISDDYTKVKKEQTAVVTSQVQQTAAIGTVASPVITAREVLSDVNWCIWLKNTDGVDPFTDADLYVSATGAANTWVEINLDDCDGLTAGTNCHYCNGTNKAFRWIYVTVEATDANPASCDSWYTANRN